ncbi:MAG: hypothetical protein Q9174_002694 [Haloplaca sp. 1 TL-2023]
MWCFKLDIAVSTIQKNFDVETRNLIRHVGFRTILSQKYRPDLASRKKNVAAILKMLPNVKSVDIKFLVAHQSDSTLSMRDLVDKAAALIGDLVFHPGLTISMFDEQGKWVEVLRNVRRVVRRAKVLDLSLSDMNLFYDEEDLSTDEE